MSTGFGGAGRYGGRGGADGRPRDGDDRHAARADGARDNALGGTRSAGHKHGNRRSACADRRGGIVLRSGAGRGRGACHGCAALRHRRAQQRHRHRRDAAPVPPIRGGAEAARREADQAGDRGDDRRGHAQRPAAIGLVLPPEQQQRGLHQLHDIDAGRPLPRLLLFVPFVGCERERGVERIRRSRPSMSLSSPQLLVSTTRRRSSRSDSRVPVPVEQQQSTLSRARCSSIGHYVNTGVICR